LNQPTGPAAAHGHTPSDADLDLPIQGFKCTPEEIERQWFEKIYTGRGDTQKQLTLRAVLMGGVLGMFMSISNLYTTLKLGWLFGVAITACILSYSIWNGLLGIRVARTPMTILENNCMQSTSSSAGYSTGSTLVSAFAAYFMINNQALPLGLTLFLLRYLASSPAPLAFRAQVQRKLVLLLNPFAPYLAAELWSILGEDSGALLRHPWPDFDPVLAKEDEVEIVVQFNGKLRSRLTVAHDAADDAVRQAALDDEKVQQALVGKQIVKIITVPDKLVNIVVK